MAQAQGRILSVVRGSIENGKPHYAFVRNGRQFIGCVRNGWNTELHTDNQKINALNFAYASAVSNMLNAVHKAGISQTYTRSIAYLFRYVKVGRHSYFFDETLFESVNTVLAKYFRAPFFTQDGTFNDDADYEHPIFKPAADIKAHIDSTEKTAFRYAIASILMANADRLDLPTLYDDLSRVQGAQYDEDDIYPLADVYEVYSLLKLDLWRWASIPVYTIEPQNYDLLLQQKAQGADHRLDFPAYTAELAWLP